MFQGYFGEKFQVKEDPGGQGEQQLKPKKPAGSINHFKPLKKEHRSGKSPYHRGYEKEYPLGDTWF